MKNTTKVKLNSKQLQYDSTRKYYHNKNNQIIEKDTNHLQILLIGPVIDAVSSFAVSRPKHICILDEVVTSSRAYKEGEASGWDDFLENGKSDMWDELKLQSKESLQYISKKRIPLMKINQMKFIVNRNNGMHAIERGCFADIRLEKVVKVDVSGTDITDADMADLGRACPYMQKLDICSCINITDVGLIEFSRYCHGLKNIEMLECENITNAGLIGFSKNCRGLNEINLADCVGIMAGGIEGLSQHCRELQIIFIGDYNDIEDYGRIICSDADLLALSINCQYLQEISFFECHDITDEGLIEMSKHLNSAYFNNISINSCNNITDKGLIAFFKNCSQITCIKVYGINFTEKCMIEILKNCSDLIQINLSANKWVTDRCLDAIVKNCYDLTNLNIDYCINITEACFINLIENRPDLEVIEVSDNDWVTDMTMNAIAINCYDLEFISVYGCKNVTKVGFLVLAKACPAVEGEMMSYLRSA